MPLGELLLDVAVRAHGRGYALPVQTVSLVDAVGDADLDGLGLTLLDPRLGDGELLEEGERLALPDEEGEVEAEGETLADALEEPVAVAVDEELGVALELGVVQRAPAGLSPQDPPASGARPGA